MSAVTPEIVLRAYAAGIFPMADSADDPRLNWIEPKRRGILPLDGFHIPRRLARTVRADRFTVVADRDFRAVIGHCAEAAAGREETWINETIRALYEGLFDIGHCHTIECYDAEGRLAGGLYGVSLGGAFFGESMFHLATDASKVALVHLVARLRLGGYQLLDAQFLTDHLATFGAMEISRRQYRAALDAAMAAVPTDLAFSHAPLSGAEALNAAVPEPG